MVGDPWSRCPTSGWGNAGGYIVHSSFKERKGEETGRSTLPRDVTKIGGNRKVPFREELITLRRVPERAPDGKTNPEAARSGGSNGRREDSSRGRPSPELGA